MRRRQRPSEKIASWRHYLERWVTQEGGSRRRVAFGWRGGRNALWQFLGVILAWLYIMSLHLHNDGLWFTGDAARHAANGLFWWDFLGSFPVHPLHYALAYYARYPVINPIAYPPGFYLFEGGSFALFGASPFVAKGLVLAFALLAGLYTTALLRCWLAEETGWGGVLLVLQPGMIVWSNAINLNIPSMALSLAALYHAQRWLDAPASRHIYPAVLFAVWGIFTYVFSGIALFVILAWIVVERHWRLFWNRTALAFALLAALVLLLCAFVALKWAPTHVAHIFTGDFRMSSLDHWLYYWWQLPSLLSTSVLVFALLSVGAAIWDRPRRRAIKRIILWVVVYYAGLSYIGAKDSRYAILMAPPVVVLAVAGLYALVSWRKAYGDGGRSCCFLPAMAALLVLHIGMAIFVRVPIVDGFRAITAFFEREAPEERIFYDGVYDGIFAFYLRAGDPGFKRGVVRGSKLLYASAINPYWRLTERVASPAEVVETLRTQCGCKWLAVEKWEGSTGIAAAGYLRQAVAGPDFQLVQSFPIVAAGTTQVDVYRFLSSAIKPPELEIPFPVLGEGVVLRAKPIQR